MTPQPTCLLLEGRRKSGVLGLLCVVAWLKEESKAEPQIRHLRVYVITYPTGCPNSAPCVDSQIAATHLFLRI
jgi:hypothetical protein